MEGRELILVNAYIPEYAAASRFNHEPRRPRKLLMHRRQIDRLLGSVNREGRTLIPMRLYWNDKGLAKLELAVAKGKKTHDKREAEADRDWQRDKARLMRENGLRMGRRSLSSPTEGEGRTSPGSSLPLRSGGRGPGEAW